jgi:hypothetical protein
MLTAGKEWVGMICMKRYSVGFEVLTAVVMKSTIFWNIMLCSSLKVKQHFTRTYRLHLYGGLFDTKDEGNMFLLFNRHNVWEFVTADERLHTFLSQLHFCSVYSQQIC